MNMVFIYHHTDAIKMIYCQILENDKNIKELQADKAQLLPFRAGLFFKLSRFLHQFSRFLFSFFDIANHIES